MNGQSVDCRNACQRRLDAELEQTFPASDPPSVSAPHAAKAPVERPAEAATDGRAAGADGGADAGTSGAIARLNELLRGEISAAETYKVAMDHIDDPELERELRRIVEEHGAAIARLRQDIKDLGGEPVEGSGVWGKWARLVERAACLAGDRTALRTLREGELIGLDDYRKVVSEFDVPDDVRRRLRDVELPNQLKHVQRLDRLLSGA